MRLRRGRSTPRLLLVVGLQKSGTSLLARLLEHVVGIDSPFRGEGDALWGNEPPHAPTGEPVGRAHQRDGGAHGHAMGADDIGPRDAEVLERRLARAGRGASIVLNKNPYNTVRLTWLRQVLPSAYIVGIVRDPTANVYSLLKKHRPHDERGPGPVDGWWGVKPDGWRDLVDDDLLLQCSNQWSAVNDQLARDRAHLDVLVGYDELCRDPAAALGRIARDLGVELDATAVPDLRSADDEHERGARLLSKNRVFRQTGAFELPTEEPIELAPLRPQEVDRVRATCASTASRFPELG
jgi:hypothetical protein